MKFRKFSFYPEKTTAAFRRQLVSLRAKFAVLPKKVQAWVLGGASAAVAAVLVLLLVLLQARPDLTFASGVYTTSATDADGNALLAHNSVNDTAYYDLSSDSTPETQRQLGVDPNWANGVTAKAGALKFDGSNDYVNVPFSSTLNAAASGQFTASVWVRDLGSPSTPTGIMGLSQYQTCGFSIGMNSGAYTAWTESSGSSTGLGFGSGSSAVQGAWKLLTITYSNGTGRSYVNGAFMNQVSNMNYAQCASTNALRIGGTYQGSWGTFTGTIDDPRLYLRALSDAEVAKLYAREEVSQQSLAGHWNFDELSCESANPCYAQDASQYGNNGQLLNGSGNSPAADGSANGPVYVSGSNAIADGFKGCGPEDPATCQNPSGRSGAGNVSITADSSTASDNAYEVQVRNSPALSFDGVDDSVVVPDAGSMVGTSQHTVSAWVKTTAATAYFLTKNSTHYNLRMSGGKVVAQVVPSTYPTDPALTVTSAASFNDGQWHHMVSTWNSGTLTLYVDGVQLGQATSPTATINAATGPIHIGNYVYAACPGGCWVGANTSDDYRLYSRALSASEVADLYASRPVSNVGLKGWWKFDEGSGTVARDSSGNGNNGTLYNTYNNSPAADGASVGPAWAEGPRGGSASSARTSDSPSWALEGYQYREPLKIANGASGIPAGHSLQSPVTRSSKLDALQTRPDGNDWRVVYQPSDAKRGLGFSGSQGAVLSPAASVADFGAGDFSFSIWVKAASVPGPGSYPRVLNKETGSVPRAGYYLLLNGDNGKFTFGTWENGSNSAVGSAQTVSAGVWYHVVGVRTGGTMSLVVNGQRADASVGLRNISSSTNLLLGQASTGAYFSGAADDVRMYSAALSSADIAALYNGGAGTPNQVGSGLVGWWRLDEGSGQILQDSSGNANHGYLGTTTGSEASDPSWGTDAVVSTAYEVPRYIPREHALSFNGTSTSVAITNPAAVQGSKPSGTVSAWMWRNATDGTIRTLYDVAATGATGLILFSDYSGCAGSGRVVLQYGTGSGIVQLCSPSALSNGAWHHVAGTWGPDGAKLYVDGALVASNATLASVTIPSTSYLGSHGSTQRYHNGRVAGVRLYDKALSADQIKAMYANAAAVSMVPETGLLAGYRFSEGAGTSLADMSGNAANGTISNGTWVANQGVNLAAKDTYFTAQAPIAASATSTDYFVYYGNPGESGSPSSSVPHRTGIIFGGTDDKLTVPDDTALDIGAGSKTWSFWVRQNGSPAADRFLYRKSDANNDMGVYITLVTDGRIDVRVGGNVTYAENINNAVSVADGAWHLVTAVLDRGSNVLNVYVDGGSATSASASAISAVDLNAAAIAQIGGDGSTASRHLEGAMDDFRIYSRALSATEVADLYSNVAPVSKQGLVAHWKLDEGSGSTAANSVSGSHAATLGGFDFGATSGWLLNENLLDLANAPTLSAALASADVNEPWFFAYRALSNPTAPSGSWSSYMPMSSAPTQLGSTGVKVKFNLNGAYARLKTYKIASWAVEAHSTSAPQRGKRRSFPEKANIVATNGGVDIIDAQTNKLWMRVPTGASTSNSLMYSGDHPRSVAALNGRVYVGKVFNQNSSIDELQFDADGVRDFRSSAGNRLYQGGIAQRASDSGFEAAAGTAPYKWVPSGPKQLSVAVIGGKQYLATGAAPQSAAVDASVVHDVTGISPGNRTTRLVRYGRATDTFYGAVALTAQGTLYAANLSAGGVDRWDSVQNDTSDQNTSADRSYIIHTGTTSGVNQAILRNATVNSIGVSVGASAADYASNAVAVGTDAGVDVINEHSSIGSATVSRYVEAGSAGTSGWNSKGFGEAVELDGSNDYLSVANSASLSLTGALTLEAWIRPSSTASNQTVVRYGTTTNERYSLAVTSAGALRYEHHDGGGYAYVDSNAGVVSAGTWKHVAVTRSANNLSVSFFVDGVSAGTATLSGAATTSGTPTLVIGTANGGGSHFSGLIDELRISSVIRYASAFSAPSREFGRDADTVALWHFNEPGGQYASDSSSNSNQATLGANSSASTDDPLRVSPALEGAAKVSAAAFTRAADTGKGLSFDGTTDFAAAPAHASLDLTSSLSIGMWINPTVSGNSAFRTLLSKRDVGGTNYELYLSNAAGSNAGALGFWNGTLYTSTYVPPVGTWTHVAATISGTSLALYANGQLVHTATIGALAARTGASLNFGQVYTNGQRYQGSMDDVRIYGRQLEGGEVVQLHNGGRGWNGIADTGLVAAWNFNEGSGQSAADYSGNGNHVTLGATSAASTDDPSWAPSTPVRNQPALWVATNGASANDGGVTAVSLASNRAVESFVAGSSLLPDSDVTSLFVADGGLALVGTEAGAWNPGLAGFPVFDPVALAGSPNADVRVKQDTRLKGGTRLGN